MDLDKVDAYMKQTRGARGGRAARAILGRGSPRTFAGQLRKQETEIGKLVSHSIFLIFQFLFIQNSVLNKKAFHDN